MNGLTILGSSKVLPNHQKARFHAVHDAMALLWTVVGDSTTPTGGQILTFQLEMTKRCFSVVNKTVVTRRD
jgi:hypothetical protein